mmetsp:Transcript_3388/g.9685  ORF Transcript_3388/g.9685 Transcript_3388/m.9685 type:complete len:336 (-) Transcript_3388:325-1332(-)
MAMRIIVLGVLVMLRRQYQHTAAGKAELTRTAPQSAKHRRRGTTCASPSTKGLSGDAAAFALPLQELPAPLLQHICLFLGADTLTTLACSCSELREAATDDRLWHGLFQKRFPLALRRLAEHHMGSLDLPWRYRYWAWERSWRQQVLRTQEDIWGSDPQLLLHGRFYRVAQLINEHPGGAELLDSAMRLRRDAGDLFDFAGHPPRAWKMLEKLCVEELQVPDEHEPLLGCSPAAGAGRAHAVSESGRPEARTVSPPHSAAGRTEHAWHVGAQRGDAPGTLLSAPVGHHSGNGVTASAAALTRLTPATVLETTIGAATRPAIHLSIPATGTALGVA